MPLAESLDVGARLKYLPVVFVIASISSTYWVYVEFHCLPLFRDPNKTHGGQEFVIFNIVTCLLLVCYARCTLVHPGKIPETHEDPSWSYETPQSEVDLRCNELKQSGERRHCKWCTRYKPDRCHHCRVCQECVLKMDHHCPWVGSCIGFHNHKYYFLLLFYTSIDTLFVTLTMFESVSASVYGQASFRRMFMLLFGETLAAILGILVTGLFCFHVYIALNGMTTIEFCEKVIKKSANQINVYDRGFHGNLRSLLGDNELLWFLPCNPPSGDGLTYTQKPAVKAVSNKAASGTIIDQNNEHQPLLRPENHDCVGSSFMTENGLESQNGHFGSIKTSSQQPHYPRLLGKKKAHVCSSDDKGEDCAAQRLLRQERWSPEEECMEWRYLPNSNSSSPREKLRLAKTLGLQQVSKYSSYDIDSDIEDQRLLELHPCPFEQSSMELRSSSGSNGKLSCNSARVANTSGWQPMNPSIYKVNPFPSKNDQTLARTMKMRSFDARG